jgi:hypothetical protein
MVIFPSSGYIPHLAGRLPDSTWRAPGVAGQPATYPSRESASEVPPVVGLNDHPETWPRCGCCHGWVQEISRGQLRGLPALPVAAPGCRAGSW